MRYSLSRLALLLCSLALSFSAHATLTVTPITWDVIGLDSNRPADGPRNFPVGARICRSTGSTGSGDVTAVMAFTTSNANIDFRAGTLSSINLGPIAIGNCVDAYYEVTIAGTSAAFNTTRGYTITATDTSGSYVSPAPRQLYVELLVSQNRNATTNISYAQVASANAPTAGGLTGVPPGGNLPLIVGNFYDIRLDASTATNGYEQLESFVNFSNAIFRIIRVSSTYAANTAPTRSVLRMIGCTPMPAAGSRIRTACSTAAASMSARPAARSRTPTACRSCRPAAAHKR